LASLRDDEAGRPPRAARPALVRLFAYVRPYAALVALALLLALALGGVRYTRVYLLKPLLDDVILPHRALVAEGSTAGWMDALTGWSGAAPDAPPASPAADERAALARIRENFAGVALAALVLILALPVLHFARVYLVEYALGRIQIDLQRDLCSKLLALPLRFHRDRRRGDLLARITRDTAAAHRATALLFDDFLQAVIMIGVGSAFLFALSWPLALVSALLGPALFAVISGFGRRIRHGARRRQEKLGDVTQRLVEILAGIKVIKGFRAEAAEDAAFRRETDVLFHRSMRVVQNRVFARSLMEMLNSAMAMGLIIVGAFLVLQGRWGLSLGDLAAFAGVLTLLYPPVKTVARGSVQLLDAQPAAERVVEVLDAPVELNDAPGAVELPPVSEGVSFRGVSFSYGGEPVLREVDFDVRAGEMVAIVGPTGGGKTTLVDLLLRLHDPTSGSVTIDGLDIRRVTRTSLLAQIAVVTEEPFLFDGTIRDNLLYGRPDATDSELRSAARAAHLDEFVSKLPMGYETEVGAAGSRLSGGQRQRITIARAILRDPAILIFDEATSLLDSKSERCVQEAIAALLGGRTVFVVAHRLPAIHRADKIVVLEEGRIAQIGTHPELMRSGGLYRELVELQTPPPVGPAPPLLPS
jgi:subfamily B ATP-binding cassette protein MsbA